jgi:hypothetical protein
VDGVGLCPFLLDEEVQPARKLTQISSPDEIKCLQTMMRSRLRVNEWVPTEDEFLGDLLQKTP